MSLSNVFMGQDVEKMAKSNICILGSKSLPNMHGVRKRRQLFAGCWKQSQEILNLSKILAKLKTTLVNN